MRDVWNKGVVKCEKGRSPKTASSDNETQLFFYEGALGFL